MFSEIQKEIYQHGHLEEYKIVSISEKLLEIRNEFLDINTSNVSRVEFKESLAIAKKKSEDFMKSTFNLHNITILTMEELKMILNRARNISLNELHLFNEMLPKVDPYKIPIEQKDVDFQFGVINEFYIGIDNEEAIRRMDTIYKNIIISSIITNLTSGILSHEITHTQLNSVKGATLYYHNSEVLPIFVQMLENMQKDSTEKCLNTELYIRCREIIKDINHLENYYQGNIALTKIELYKTSKYIESALKALKLFEIYYNSTKRDQQKIINYIQKIFDGEYNVEGLLEKHNIKADENIKIHQKIRGKS